MAWSMKDRDEPLMVCEPNWIALRLESELESSECFFLIFLNSLTLGIGPSVSWQLRRYILEMVEEEP